MNDPSAVDHNWLNDYTQTFNTSGAVAYTLTVVLLTFASVTLYVNTQEGILEMITCTGMLMIDIFSMFSEASLRKKSRQNRSRNFIGPVHCRRGNSNEEWKEISGIDLRVGDIIKLSIGSVVPADVKWLKGSTFLCETTFAINGDHRYAGGVGGDYGNDLSGIVLFGPQTSGFIYDTSFLVLSFMLIINADAIIVYIYII
jgi:high-affinity K+ transport system ATPase subunit B